jgi:hypothetical protein
VGAASHFRREEITMHRFKVFRFGGEIVVGRYGSKKLIPCGRGKAGFELAFQIIRDMQCGVAYCSFDEVARITMAAPLSPMHPQLRLRAGVAA